MREQLQKNSKIRQKMAFLELKLQFVYLLSNFWLIYAKLVCILEYCFETQNDILKNFIYIGGAIYAKTISKQSSV